jgi:hypothetical protein
VCRIPGRKAARNRRASVAVGHQRARSGTRTKLRGPFGNGSAQCGSEKEASHDRKAEVRRRVMLTPIDALAGVKRDTSTHKSPVP